MTTICIDVMGSDCEPSIAARRVAKALELDSELRFFVTERRLCGRKPFARCCPRPAACRRPRYRRGHRWTSIPPPPCAEEGCKHRSRRLGARRQNGRPRLRQLHRRRARGCDLQHQAHRASAVKARYPDISGKKMIISTVAPTPDTSSQTRVCSLRTMGRACAQVMHGVEGPAWRFSYPNGSGRTPGLRALALSYHQGAGRGGASNCGQRRAQTFSRAQRRYRRGRWLHGQRCPEDH